MAPAPYPASRRLGITYINIMYQNRPLTKISRKKKKLTPRDYLYKHCVQKSATWNQWKYEKYHPKVFNSPKTSPAPRMARRENYATKN